MSWRNLASLAFTDAQFGAPCLCFGVLVHNEQVRAWECHQALHGKDRYVLQDQESFFEQCRLVTHGSLIPSEDAPTQIRTEVVMVSSSGANRSGLAVCRDDLNDNIALHLFRKGVVILSPQYHAVRVCWWP